MLLTAVLSGCLEYETTTTVHPDGSFTRSITVRGDSAALHSWSFNIPADASWTVVKREKVEDDTWTLTAERTYSSDDEWESWQPTIDRRVLRCSVTVESSYRFFTTTYRYTETIPSYNPFTLIPVTDYIAQAELDAFLRTEVFKEPFQTPGDSMALEDAGDRFEEWEMMSRIESYYQAIMKHLEPDAAFDSTRRANLKESLISYFSRTNPTGKKEFEDPDPQKFKAWTRTLNDPSVSEAVEGSWTVFEQFKRDVDYIHSVNSDSHASRIQLPGEIVFTNGSPEGRNAAVWEDYISYAYVGDFTMVAESSVLHVWAIILVVSAVVGIPVIMWGARLARQRRTGTVISA
jgi:hypothetical protein